MSKNTNFSKECGASEEDALTFRVYANRETRLGNLEISRALPMRERRLVGPWCFLDYFGPLTFKDEKPMHVPPHPHIGLQTVSWLLEGEVRHSDSLNFQAIVKPGGVNVMTAGKGIAHAEETPTKNSGSLCGVQLWVALPDEHRNTAPDFLNVPQVPIIEKKGGVVKLFAGTLESTTAPARYFSDIIGMEVAVHARQSITLPLNTRFEHAGLLLDGDGTVEGHPLSKKNLYYLGTHRESLAIKTQAGCKVLLIGGVPFPEKILMWWNFVARTPDEIRQARSDWEAERFFGEVEGTQLQRLSAPELDRFASPNPAS